MCIRDRRPARHVRRRRLQMWRQVLLWRVYRWRLHHVRRWLLLKLLSVCGVAEARSLLLLGSVHSVAKPRLLLLLLLLHVHRVDKARLLPLMVRRPLLCGSPRLLLPRRRLVQQRLALAAKVALWWLHLHAGV